MNKKDLLDKKCKLYKNFFFSEKVSYCVIDIKNTNLYFHKFFCQLNFIMAMVNKTLKFIFL